VLVCRASWPTAPRRSRSATSSSRWDTRRTRWKLGRNLGGVGEKEERLLARLQELRERYGRKVSVIGWSLGGMYARELAWMAPDHVRLVITLGTPFRHHTGTAVTLLYEDVSGQREAHMDPRLLARLSRPPPVPATSIYTRTTGWSTGAARSSIPRRTPRTSACTAAIAASAIIPWPCGRSRIASRPRRKAPGGVRAQRDPALRLPGARSRRLSVKAFFDAANELMWGSLLIWLLLGAGVLFTVLSGFIQVRHFAHTFGVMKRSFRREHGGISSFEAYCTSLGARVGTGNLAGVAVALELGGPGAVFWMWVTAMLGMATSFFESTLASFSRCRTPTAAIAAALRIYMQHGLGKRWMGVLFSVFLIIRTRWPSTACSRTPCPPPWSR
jgi:pimeloyl-ACP methyl ester carboxylesterase